MPRKPKKIENANDRAPPEPMPPMHQTSEPQHPDEGGLLIKDSLELLFSDEE
jgi:hypothetical protein